jgi:hypothetical protein
MADGRVSVTLLAQRTGYTPYLIRRWCETGKLIATRTPGRQWRIVASSAFATLGRLPPTDPVAQPAPGGGPQPLPTPSAAGQDSDAMPTSDKQHGGADSCGHEITSDNEHLPCDPERATVNSNDRDDAPQAAPGLRQSNLLDAAAMAAYLGGKPAPGTLVRWARECRIPAIKVGRAWMFNPADVVAALAQGYPPVREVGDSSHVDPGCQPRQIRRAEVRGRSARRQTLGVRKVVAEAQAASRW